MTDRIEPLNSIFYMNTKLFTNCLEGIDNDTYLKRANDCSNNMAFVACHIIDARFYMGSFLGVEIVNPYKEVFDKIKNPEQAGLFPPPEKVAELWKEISITIENKFKVITDDELQKESPMQFPLTEKTILHGLTFLLQHESFHIGQLALLRKYFNFPAMRYI